MRSLLSWLAVLLTTVPASAHYHMLLPDLPTCQTGQTVTLTWQYGHPFEHQLFATAAPDLAKVVAPDGKETDLAGQWQKAEVPGAEGQKVTVYRHRFTPDKRGDYVFLVRSPAVVLEGKQKVRDTVKVILHVQTQRGWDAPTKQGLELTPLTRPYGLRAGMVFQARATRSLANRPDLGETAETGLLVEIERYNATPPKELPPDEHITRAAKTDPVGVVTCTLPEPGWWGLTAFRPVKRGKKKDPTDPPVLERTTLWVHVDDRVPVKAAE